MTVGRDDPLAATAEVECSARYRRDAWDAKTVTATRLSCDRTNFYLTGHVQTFANGKPFVKRSLEYSFKRDYL